jgi:dolichol-phosphate mannosyltransferase
MEKNYISLVVVVDENTEPQKLFSFIQAVTHFCAEKFDNYEFIFVNNNAEKDNIDQIEKYFSNSGLMAYFIALPYKLDKEKAMIIGVDASIGDFVFEFEDTLSDYSTLDLWKMYEIALNGYDIVLLRRMEKMSYMRALFYQFLTKYSNKNSTIYPSRVHLISRRAINQVNNMQASIYYRKYMYCNSGLPYHYLSYQTEQKGVKDTVSFEKIDFATDLLLLFTGIGQRVTLIFSALFASFATFSFFYTIFNYLTKDTIAGWTTTMLFLSVSFAGIFIVMTIMIKYLNLILKKELGHTILGRKNRI